MTPAYRCQRTATGWVIVTPSEDEGKRFYEALAEFAETIRQIEQQPRERQKETT
jgi:hypothetical protein